MDFHFVTFSYTEYEGYGRYSNRLIKALQKLGKSVLPLLPEHVSMPDWMKAQVGIERDVMTISCLPPYLLQDAPSGGRHWLISMTEGSELPSKPDDWAAMINASDVERVIVPCEHNALAFRNGGVKVPVHVVPGGTDPTEFPMLSTPRPDRPYTFLALGDRGGRKGWTEVYSAFLRTFKTEQDVKLIVKVRKGGNELVEMMANNKLLDPRIQVIVGDVDMRVLYASVDCFAIPSRSEGWGMPMREAAMMGLPVIVQKHSGLDDGHTDCWALTLTKGHTETIPERMGHIKGTWIGADVDELADKMRWCYENPKDAAFFGTSASEWLEAYQTWDHSVKALLDLIAEYA